LNLWIAFKEQIVIKLLEVTSFGKHRLALVFSDGVHGFFDGDAYLATRQGPLLEPLRDAAYFARCFVDAGALCWPNGLELSAARLHGLVENAQAA